MSGFQEGSALNPSEASAALLRGEWPDFYALLGVAPDADTETLRRRIRESYVEATTNADHRVIARRIHFQTMAEQVLPQCHRILLDDKARAAYDEQSRLHREGDARAREYSSFLSNTLGGDETQTRDETAHMILGSAPESPSDTHQKEMEEARALLESLGRGTKRDATPRGETKTETRDSGEAQNREEARLRARYLENNSQADSGAELSSRIEETPRAESAASTRDASARQEENFSARLNARIAPPETNADLASVSSSDSTVESSAQPDATPVADAKTQTASESQAAAKPRLSSRAFRNVEAVVPLETAPEVDEFPLASSAPETAEATSTRAPSEANNAATVQSAMETPADAQTAAEIARLQSEIAARRNARANSQQISEPATKPRAALAPRETVRRDSAAKDVAAPADDFVVADAYRSEKFSDESLDVLPTFEETAPAEAASTRGAAESGARSAREIERDFADAPKNTVRARTIFAPRVSLGENPDSVRAVGSAGQRKRVLSQAAMNVLVGLIATVATLIIFRPGQNTGPVGVPINVLCASQVHPFLQRAEAAFESSPQGAGIDINLSPIDSREAMRYALDKKTAPPHAWIPSETLWSDRYNQVAAKSGGKPIRVARPLALSPIVLLARSEQAATLRRKFPNRIVSSWQSLQDAVKTSAQGHFGMTDPGRSGSGSIARLFMAREWCEKNRVEWNEKALSDKRLWTWMQGFENNVPSYGKLTSDMARDLALGTADRYWWALVYESDAISWMKQGKNVEVFYLPRSNFADHPFCRIEGAGNGRLRDRFEAFLRGPQMQKALLENGFRPVESEISSRDKNNPFNNPNLKKRGLKAKGFRIDDRINYKLLNTLNVQWAQRYRG